MGKKIVGFNLSATAQHQVVSLARAFNLEKSAVIEALLRNATKAVARRIGEPVIKAQQSVRGPDYTVADLLWPADDATRDAAAIAVVRANLLKNDPAPQRRRLPPSEAEARMASLFRNDPDPGKLVNAFFGQPQPARENPHLAGDWAKGAKDD